MADNKLQYRISIGGQSQTWDADKYERNKDALMTKYPDAKVEEVHMSSKSDLEPSADRYLVTINGMSQEWDSDRMNRNREKLLQKYPDAQIERVTNTVPMFDDEPNAPMTAHLQSVANPIDNDTNEIKPLGGYWANVKEGAKELWAQGKYIVGEGINLLTGTNRDELAVINDIENLEERGIDPSEFIKKQEDSEFVSAYGMSKEEFMKLSKDKRTELIKKASSKNAKVIMPDEVDDVKQKAKHAENLRDLYWSALEEADGNLEKAKQILAKKAAEEESLGDKIIEGAIEDAKKIRPSEGFAGYLGRLTTQMIPNASAIALAALSKGKSAKASAWLMGGSKALGMAGMAGLTASAGGSAMMEAREKGASNEEVWASAFAAMGIEAITEWIPYDTYTKDIYSAIKKKIGKDIKKEVFENTASAGMKEFKKLIEEANKKLGGKLLNGKSIKDWFVQTLTEGVSEFFAEAGGTMVPMIYEEPEKYPTLSRIFLNGLEGMKAGLLMGAVLGGASQATSHSLNKDRRKQQGFVNVAQVDFGNGDVDVAELVGKNEENGKYIVLRGNETEEVDREQIIFNKHFTYNEFESARYKQLTDEAIDNGTVTDGQVVASADRVGDARKSLDKAMTDAGYTEEQKNAAFNALDNNAYPDAYENLDDKVAKAMDGYLEAKGRDKAVQDAKVKREQNEKDSLRQEIEQQVGGRFWRESEDGDSVEVGTLKDGRVVYILSDVNENGEASAVTEKGEQIIINVDMLNDVTLRSSLDEFLSARVKEGKKQAEQARMSAEATPQLNEIRAKAQPGVQVNLGTADSPIVGTILQIKPEGDGVLIQTESGVEAYTYEQLGDIFGTPVRVLTDEQIAAAEAAEIESADAARSAEVAQDSEQMDEVEAEVDTAVKNEDVATETPLPTNPDGSVNEDALFAENPARWAEWNDAERNDGGENSRAYIQGKIDRANAKIAELQKAYDAEDSLNKKKALEKEIASQKEIVASLSEVMQRYAPKQEDILTPTAEVKAKIAAEKMEAIQKRVEKWEKRLGLKINILRSIDEVKDPSALETIAKGRTRAWFDPNTLEVYVYAPHIAVLRTEFIDKDVDEAIFHEVVGHKGIKQMLKPEEFDQLLDRVWSEVMTEADRIRYSRYAGVKGNTRRAADEYMAHISEGMQYDSIWNKIANWFKDLIGFEVNIETATVEQILRESYRNFGKNTGATTTPEGAKQDVMPSVIETLSEDLTMDEIREVTSNDLAIAQQTYDALVANAPVVEQGESSADYIARKRAYNEQLNAAMADLEAKRAIVDEVAMLETPEGAGNELSEEASVEILEANGMEVNEDTDDILFSHRYGLDEQMRDKVLDGIVKVTGRPREDAEKWLESEQSATALVLADKQYLDYVPDDRYKAIKDNSDYPQGTVDFNNICRKRVSFTKMFTRLQRRFPNRVFTADDLADIRTIMSNDGLVVACGLCYVEDRRQMVGEVAAFFIDQMQKDFIDYTYEVSAKDFVAGKMKKKKSQSKDKVKKAAKYKILIGNDTYVPKVYDLTTLEGLDKLYREHRGIWDAFQAFNSDRGQQSQNLFQGYAEYKREILSWSDAKVKKVNSLGGLRVFSYSDFEAHHLLDLIQIIIDCAARGVMIQGYTKVPEFARAVAMTGIKLNRSLIPLGDTGIVDGKLAYDPIEGIDVNDPNFFESNDNVGNILIGINDEQIRLAMAEPFIHYIIPYHARQAEGIRMKLKVGKWENYIDTQNERNVRDGKRVKKGINIYTDVLDKSITNDREFVEKYLAVCKKKGYIPKFDQFLNRDAEGNYVYTPGYHKFLVDFKLFDENGNILPQRPVVAQFDDAFNAEVLQKYVAEEKETTGAQMNETYKKIVEALELNEEEAEGEDLMFSSEVDDLKTMTLGEINRRFNAELQQQIDGTLPEGHIYSLGLPSNKLLSAGLSNLPIEMPASRLVDKSMQENHPYKLSDVMNLPSAIQRPLAVFISATHIGSHVILTELNVKGRNFVAALRVMPTGKSIMINRIRSLYPKNTMAIVDWVTDNLGTTYDRTKMLDWLETKKSEMLSKPQSNSVDVRKRFASATKVVKEFVNPTLKIENLYSTRVDEDRAKLFDAAKVEFGVTNNFNVAGYMLPDGSLLDFSEAKDGGDPNDRTLDHRAVSRIIEDREYDSRYAYIVDFMNEGAIRIIPEHAGVQLSAAPTAEQRQKLLDYFYKENGYVILEVVGKDGGTIFNLEYDRRTSPYRIMRDIEGYFNEGIVPQQSEIMFSTSNRNQAIFVSNAAKAVEGIKMEDINLPHLENGLTMHSIPVTEEYVTLFSTRTKPAPTKTQMVYKLMRLGADGRLYPLYIDSAEGIELKVWYDADSPNMGDIENLEIGYAYKIDENGNVVDKKKYNKTAKGSISALPNKEQVNSATNEKSRWIVVDTYADGSKAFYNVGINGSGTPSLFGMRPGWHAGSLPTMRQIGKGPKKDLRDDSFVWVRGYIPADIDYQAEADANSSKDIQTHIPTDGYYLKATNANKKASQADKMGWYIAGSFYADEIISDAEARRVIDEWNTEHPDANVEYDYPRESGKEYDPARGGLVDSEVLFSTESTNFASAITPEVRKEMDVISAQAIVNGNYLKAPNGKDTKLTPEQWALVRTQNFKKWFGDWINDPENASKVVDENGEPKVVYHQTNAVVYINRETGENWDELDWRARQEWDERDDWEDYWEEQDFNTFSRVNARTTNEFDGFFFAPEYDEYHEYGKRTIPAFLNIKNPASNEDYNIDSTKNNAGRDERLRLQNEGFDGVIRMEGEDVWEYVAFSPNQIKSATENNGEFSEKEDIRFSTRQPNQSAESFFKQTMRDYVKKYGNLAAIIIEPVNEETAKKYGYTLEELKKVSGAYLGKRGVAIFAQEDVTDSDEVESSIYHETLHHLIKRYPNLLETGKYFWDLAENDEWLKVIREEIEEAYAGKPIEEMYEEMLCYAMELYAGLNGLDALIETLSDQARTDVEFILNKTKYGRLGKVEGVSKDSSRREEDSNLDRQDESESRSGEDAEGTTLFSTGREIDDLLEKGLPLSVEEYTNLAANIFKSMPEDMRKEVVENASRDNWDLKKATFQMVTRLAEKSELNDEEIELAKLIAQKVDDAVRAIDIQLPRPLTTNEALWTLYQSTNRISDYDVLGAARKAAVADNLGFSPKAKAEREKLVEEIMFSTASDANNNATANLYNKGVVNYKTRLKESFVDMHASVEELVKAIEKASGKVAKGFEDILLALNQQSSKGLAAMEAYEQKFLEPMFNQIVKIMKEAKVSYDDVVRYVILKHGLERNDKMAKRDAKEFWTNVYGKVANMMKGQSHASLVVALSDAKAKVQEIEAKLATAKGAVKSKLQEQLDNAKLDVTIVELALRNDEKANEQELKDRLDAVEAGTDAKYKELRNQDYSGISSMFYDTLGVDRKQFDTEEAYQTALMRAKAHKYDTLADIEGAAQMEVDLFEKTANTKGLWKSINAATKEILRQQYMANMISKEQYESLRDMFQFYVPLRGFADNTAEDMYTYYRKPNSTGYTKPILGAEGRSTEAESPFGWIASMASSAIASNVKNEAKLALYYFVSNRPDNGVATISKTWYVDSGEVDARGRKIFKPAYPPFTEDLSSDQAKADYEAWQENMRQLRDKGMAYESGQRLNLGDSVVNINEKNRPEHVVNVKIGGKDYTIIINGNPRAAQAINGDLNIEAVAQDYSKVFGPMLRWMSSVNTSYNPEFWVTNTMRDMLFTWMSVNVSNDPEYKKKFGKNYRKAFKVLSLTRKYEKGTLGNSQLENLYKEFVKNGGVTGYTQIKDNETWEKEIAKYMKSKNVEDKKTGIALRYIKRGLHAMHRIGESLEQVSRFAAFLTAKEMGMSTSESVNKAKEITVNFNRKGSGQRITLEEAAKLTNDKGQPLNKLQQWFVWGLSSIAPLGRRSIMFFNASIQGLNAYYKLYKSNPKKMATWAAGYAIIGILNAIMHSLLDEDDDYMDMPDYERRTSLMLGGNGIYFKWALPQEARVFYALGDLAVESILGRNPHESILGEALKLALDVAPLNPTEGWRAVVPSVALPFIELLANEDYKGDPIYNEMKWLSDEEKKHTPKWENAYQGTGKPFILLSKLMNGVSDWGDTDKAGLFNVHPESIEHLVESAFGGTIRTAEKGFNTVWNMFDPDEEMTVRQAPFLNRILTINKERYTNVHTSEVFDYYLGYLDSVDTRLKKYRKENDVKNYNELMESDEVKWLMIYNNKYKKPLKRIKEEIKTAKNSSEKKEFMRLQDQLRKDFIKEISNL